MAFEVQDGVHQVLENPRARDLSSLGDVSHQDDRKPAGLGQTHQAGGTLTNLCHASRRRGQVGSEEGLDRVDDDQAGIDLLDSSLDGLQAGLGQEQDAPGTGPRPWRAAGS